MTPTPITDDAASVETAVTDETLPKMLSERAEDPRRMLQAARAMSVLEEDLRLLLKRSDGTTIGPDTVTWAADSYRKLRDVVVGELAGSDVDDDVIGLPTLDEPDPTFSTLLLKISQATRYLSVEDGWPGVFVTTRMQSRQMREAYTQLRTDAEDDAQQQMFTGGPGTGTPYL